MTGALQQYIRGVYGEPSLRLPNIIAVRTDTFDGVTYFMDDGTNITIGRDELAMARVRYHGEERDLVLRRWVQEHGGKTRLAL